MREEKLQLRFHGAAGEVTGSLHRLEVGDKQVLIDCGLIQGGGKEDQRNAAGFGFDPRQLDAVVVVRAKDVAAGTDKKEIYDLQSSFSEGTTIVSVPVFDGDVVYVPTQEEGQGMLSNASGLMSILFMARSIFAL